MWAIHWFGLEGSQMALDNLARVLKSGASSVIATLTPYDILFKDHIFSCEKISRAILKGLYPDAKILRQKFGGKNSFIVQNDLDVRRQLELNGGNYYISNSHPDSIVGRKTLIGFTPKYLREEFIKRGLEVIEETIKPNNGFPNSYPPTLPEGRTHLIYVVRKR
jgi:hypothetical protein